MEIMRNLIFSLFILVFISSCSHQQCNNVPQNPSNVVAPQSLDEKDKGKASPTKPALTPTQDTETILVFKQTGELQCEPGSGSPIEKFQSILTKNKIPVIESSTQNDGLMHMAVCGTPKGQIHVFKILTKFKAKALKLGFKLHQPK